MTPAGLLIETEPGLAALIPRLGRADRLAVDVESNGLFAYRAALCVLQLAWREGEETIVAVVDTLAMPIAALAPILGEGGPVKVLHDLTLDAQLLAAAGAPLGRVRDTSVAARLLGRKATGLAALLEEDLGVLHDKRLQHHDWGRRPLGEEEIAYLAGDVRHLLDLDDRLAEQAEAFDIAPEIEAECAYKLATALAPRRDARPAWTKAKGAEALNAAGRAALRRLWAAREQVAEQENVPPYKVASTELLVQLAVKRPSLEAPSRPAQAHAAAWRAAIAEAAADGDVPEEERAFLSPRPPTRAEIARRRTQSTRVTGWRRAEAERRGVSEQAVLPGHCADDLVDALLAHGPPHDRGEGALRAAILAIPGIGARRAARYLDAFVALAAP